jgi:mannitol/fructose-specific phosphotransferase system IIA component
MSEQLEAAGSSGGKVKKQAYLKYLLEIREEESLALQQGIRIPHKSVEQIRKEFEEKNGSIYVEP